MVKHLVLSFVADDRPGLVDALSQAITDAGGNWCESRMANLAEKFAGIVRVELPNSDHVDQLRTALKAFDADDIHVAVAEPSARRAASGTGLMLEIIGPDQPGIVQEITHCLARHKVSIETMETLTENAPMGGGSLFKAQFEVLGPADIDQEALHANLEKIANALIVDLTFREITDAD